MSAIGPEARRPPEADALQDAFLAAIGQNPINRAILERMPALALPDLWLVAGCLFQAVWNLRDGKPAGAGVRDYDLFYFDDRDLSWAAEDQSIRRCAALYADLGVTVELRNQARVHLWYQARFGLPCPRLSSSRHGIERFLVAGTCVGLRPDGSGDVEIYAPHGLADIFDGRLRANPNNPAPDLFARKAENYRVRWPWLVIDEAPATP